MRAGGDTRAPRHHRRHEPGLQTRVTQALSDSARSQTPGQEQRDESPVSCGASVIPEHTRHAGSAFLEARQHRLVVEAARRGHLLTVLDEEVPSALYLCACSASDPAPTVLGVPVASTGDRVHGSVSGASQPEIPVLAGGQRRIEFHVEREQGAPDNTEGDGHEVLPEQMSASVVERPSVQGFAAEGYVMDLVPRGHRARRPVRVEISDERLCGSREPDVVVVAEADQLATGDLEATVACFTRAEWAGIVHDLDTLVTIGQPIDHVRGLPDGGVVDDHQFELPDLLSEHRARRSFEVAGPIMSGKDHAQQFGHDRASLTACPDR